jgi:hypothetical protein
MRIKKKVKKSCFLNRDGEHVAGCLIHMDKNKTEWKRKTTINWCKLNEISKCICPRICKKITIYYIKCVCPRIWVSRIYVQELRWESMKKVSIKKT